MIKYIKSNIKKIMIYIGVLVGVVILLQPSGTRELEVQSDVLNDVPLESSKQISYEDVKKNVLEENNDSIIFLAKTFQIEDTVLKGLLNTNFNELGLNNNNFDLTVLNYLLELEESNKELFNNNINSEAIESDYIVKLIKYFCSLYDNVDFSIAAGIAKVESGFTSKYMLSRNNIFGGMYNGNLIRYKTIEYGTLKYIKLLSEGYFGKGLVTVLDIGRVYNPMFNENGEKIAKPNWVYNVNLAMEDFMNYEEVDTSILLNYKNN